VGGTFRGCPTLLLTHVGHKSGRPRTSPLFYVEDGQNLVLVASKGGSPKHPAWFVNLQANPTTTVQVGREKRTVTARLATADERARLWPKAVEMYPDYDAYQRHTDREIPMVILSGAGGVEGVEA
jgi:deazaflavin-dependent oxidoreductase (nitroreductase family)